MLFVMLLVRPLRKFYQNRLLVNHAILFLALWLVGLIIGGAFHVMSASHVVATVTVPGGHTYNAHSFGIAGGSTEAISQEVDSGLLLAKGRFICMTNTDSPAVATPILLPQETASQFLKKPSQSLFVLADGRLVVYVFTSSGTYSVAPRHTLTNMAYDMKSRKSYGNGS